MHKIHIVYPAGAHGHFLKLVLNTMAGHVSGPVENFIYDGIPSDQLAPFTCVHFDSEVPDTLGQTINIRVRPESYLKYAAVCLNRTSGVNIALEDLDLDTFDKISQHSIYKHFVKSLSIISGKNDGDVPKGSLREWARLCLFDQDGLTIRQWTQSSEIDDSYIVDFECFYQGQFKETCQKILDFFGVPCHNNDIDHLIEHFDQNNRYRKIDQDCQTILQALQQKHNMPLANTNFMIEAWIDQYLVQQFGIDPLLQDDYSPTTHSLLERYHLL